MPKNKTDHHTAYAILRLMKGGQKARGFTVVETLIVLAVTGALFFAVAATLSGKQSRTQFEQSIQEVRSQIQQTINEVGAGFYPNTNNFSCSAAASGPSITVGSTQQGENTGCTFIGKAIQFQVGGTDPEEFKIYTIAGLQRTATGDEPITYAEAKPKAVSPSTSEPSLIDATETKKLLYGLTTTNYGSNDIGTVAFVNKLSSNGSTIVSGAQQVNFIPIDGSPRGASQLVAAQRINNVIGTSTVNPANGISFCFVSGGSDQSGLITIGGNGRQLSVDLVIKAGTSC